MTPNQMQAFEAALDRVPELLGSAAKKVMRHNPTWSELFALLTDEEARVFIAFVLHGAQAAETPQDAPEGAGE